MKQWCDSPTSKTLKEFRKKWNLHDGQESSSQVICFTSIKTEKQTINKTTF